ncbi:MAG TPA: hypothetical protein VIL65_04800 [Beijerinckiaceae bacterium]|jgi:hypothetical protein
MEHTPLAALTAKADLTPAGPPRLSRTERLERWIDILDRDPARKLRPLHEIEYRSLEERRATRANDSPLTVAYADPVLRREGLRSDRLGDSLDFFGLTEHEAHHTLCSCHMGNTFTAKQAAKRLRSLLPRAQGGGFWAAVGALIKG